MEFLEMEKALGYPENHTRLITEPDRRQRCLGNALQVNIRRIELSEGTCLARVCARYQ
jgi:hypothetical protein